MGAVKTFAWLTLLFVSAVLMLFALTDLGHEEQHVLAVAWDYASVAVGGDQNLDAQISLLVDPLSVFMSLVVSGAGTRCRGGSRATAT